MIQYLCVALPALLAGLVQGVTGFGAGILLMMFYPFCFDMVRSTAMSQVLCAVLCISIVLRYRKYIRFRLCILPLVFYFPFYFAALRLSLGIHMDNLKPALGVFLILLAVYFVLYSGKIHITAGVLSALGCAALAGIIDAFFGIGGPTMVIYFMAVLRDKREYLGTIQLFFTMTNLYGTAVRAFSGQVSADMLFPLAAGSAALLIGACAGGKVVDRIDIEKMKLLVYGFIGFAGIVTLVTGL